MTIRLPITIVHAHQSWQSSPIQQKERQHLLLLPFQTALKEDKCKARKSRRRNCQRGSQCRCLRTRLVGHRHVDRDECSPLGNCSRERTETCAKTYGVLHLWYPNDFFWSHLERKGSSGVSERQLHEPCSHDGQKWISRVCFIGQLMSNKLTCPYTSTYF